MTAAHKFGVKAVDDVSQAADVDAVLSSLPLSLDPRPVEPVLVALAGTAGWTARALTAAQRGAAGILVVQPGTEDPVEDVAALRARLMEAAVPLVMDRPFAGNPILTAGSAAFAAADDPGAMIEVLLTLPIDFQFDVQVLDAMALCAAVVAPVADLQVVTRTATGFVLRGVLGSGHRCLVTAAATRARPPSAMLRRIGAATISEVVIPDPSTARPAQLTISGDRDARLLPTEWETSHRACWRRLLGLAAERMAAPDLDAFAGDLAIVRKLAG